ncbi:hypothetical protein EOE48_03765 [Methylobacterium oryzihabitans]|uniref:Uncharacterized protein n=1 Tax=Methylobacterium oryzihabitans TaxID=2499852 RepID=A0A3S2VU83_9HYPH|nr:hypothetical protein EOE48_03765 [Methylobacterium oryzihabitans]
MASVIGGLPGSGLVARSPVLTRHRRWPPPREIPPAPALWRARRRALPLSVSYTTPRDTTRAVIPCAVLPAGGRGATSPDPL